jgi:hypothetical protein
MTSPQSVLIRRGGTVGRRRDAEGRRRRGSLAAAKDVREECRFPARSNPLIDSPRQFSCPASSPAYVRHTVSQGSTLPMSTEALSGSDAISVHELADMRGAGKALTVLDVREARELDVCRLEGALHIPMAEISARTDDLPTVNCWWSFAIMAPAVRWSSTFCEAPGLTMQSISMAASMLGLATSTNQCRAIDSVRQTGDCDRCR